jgi:hypothetical protein
MESELVISNSQKDNTATYYCRSRPYGDVERKSVVISKEGGYIQIKIKMSSI